LKAREMLFGKAVAADFLAHAPCLRERL